jgi:hypothetical protein
MVINRAKNQMLVYPLGRSIRLAACNLAGIE